MRCAIPLLFRTPQPLPRPRRDPDATRSGSDQSRLAADPTGAYAMTRHRESFCVTLEEGQSLLKPPSAAVAAASSVCDTNLTIDLQAAPSGSQPHTTMPQPRCG